MNHMLADTPEHCIGRWLANLDYAGLVDPSPETRVPVLERFDWQGREVDPGFRRVRVLGRQAYVLCQATLAGHAQAGPLASRVVQALCDHAIGDDGLFVSRLAANGAVLDATPDLYDIAFGLFAMAWWYRLSGDERALTVSETMIGQLRAVMRSPSGAGYVSRLGALEVHEQNPHMHLFEAAIFLASFSGRPVFHALADELFALAEHQLFDPASGAIAEFFDGSWHRIPTRGAVVIEPGHQYEWVWLLHRYAALSSSRRARDMADRLFDFAWRHGHETATGLIYDGVATDGRVLEADLRIWPNTEFLKAQIAMRECHHAGPGFDNDDMERTVERIFRYFLTPSPQGDAVDMRHGLWIDYLHSDAVTPKCDFVPASSLYHIMFGFSEFVRHRGGDVPFPNPANLQQDYPHFDAQFTDVHQ